MRKPQQTENSASFLRRFYAQIAFCLAWILFAAAAWAPAASRNAQPQLEEFVLRFERSYQGVRTLKADFKQSFFAWGRTRVESGTVYLEQGGRMRWDYREPEQKLFVSTGKELLLYIPAEKQMTISPLAHAADTGIPLNVLVSRLDLKKAFSRIEFANQALHADPGDRVLRGFARFRFRNDFSSALIELTSNFDIRRLVMFYPDNSTMQFEFSNFHRNVAVNPSLFSFTPPPGTEIIHQ
jgi:outer membrane lipoprotein carrier protein